MFKEFGVLFSVNKRTKTDRLPRRFQRQSLISYSFCWPVFAIVCRTMLSLPCACSVKLFLDSLVWFFLKYCFKDTKSANREMPFCCQVPDKSGKTWSLNQAKGNCSLSSSLGTIMHLVAKWRNVGTKRVTWRIYMFCRTDFKSVSSKTFPADSPHVNVLSLGPDIDLKK